MNPGDEVVTIWDGEIVCGTYLRKARPAYSWVRVGNEERVYDNSRMVRAKDMIRALYESSEREAVEHDQDSP